MAAGAIGTAYVDVEFDDRQIGRQVDGLGSRIRGGLGKAARIGGLAIAAGLAAGVVGIKATINAASDLDESINKSAQTFERAAPSVERWSETTATALGLSQQAALEGAASIGAMLKPMGVAPKSAADMSTAMVQLAADMASFNNEDPSAMLDRIRAGLSGESEPLKRYGTVLSEARVQQFAWANGIAESGAKLTEQQKIMGRYGLLLQDTADQQGDFGRTSEGLANQQRILSAQLQDGAATLGRAFLPIAVQVVGALNAAVPRLIAFGQAVIANVGPPLQQVADVVRQHWPQVQAVIETVVGAVRALLGGFAGDASSSSSQIGGAVSTLRTIFETVFRAIGVVVDYGRQVVQRVANAIRAHSAEITATVQALRRIFEAVWPAIARVIEVAWTLIKVTIDTALKVIGNLIRAVMAVIRGDWQVAWSSIAAAAKALLSGMATAIKTILSALAPAVLGLAKTVGGMILRGIANGLATLASMLAQQLAKIPLAIAAAAQIAFTAAVSIGRRIIDGVLSGVGGLLGSLRDKVSGMVRGALDKLNPFSPVEHGGEKYIGRPIAEGAIRGWLLGSASLPDKIAEGVRAAVERGRAAIDSARGRFADAWGNLSSDLRRAFDAAWSGPTAAEQQLESLRREAEQGRLADAIAGAQAALTEAQAGTDPDRVLAAQRQLDEALRAQLIYDLEQRAAVERRERDAEVELKRRRFEDDLAALQQQLARRGATEQQAQAAILRLLRSYGVEYTSVGDQLGKAFVTGLREQLQRAVKEARRIAREIEEALAGARKAVQQAGSGPGPRSLGAPGVPATGPLTAAPGPLGATSSSGGVVGRTSPTRLLASVLGRAVAGTHLEAEPSLDGLEVRVFIGDRELVGIVRHEVEQHDAGIATTLLAGAGAVA